MKTTIPARWLAWFAACAVIGSLGATFAGAQLGVGGSHPTTADMQQAIRLERAAEREARANRCIPQRTYRWRFVTEIPQPRLKGVLVWQQSMTADVRRRRSDCPHAIIRQVFGPTSSAAIRVAACESTGDDTPPYRIWPKAVGDAGERGMFQIHPVHRSWLGARWDRLFEPLVNARVAYGMSDGGTDWSAWSCQP